MPLPAVRIASTSTPAERASDVERVATIERPDPGLARGHFEAPAWMFWTVAAAALLGGLVWVALAIVQALRARKTRP